MTAAEQPATRQELARHVMGAVVHDDLPAPHAITIGHPDIWIWASVDVLSLDDLRPWATWLGAEGIEAKLADSGSTYHKARVMWRGRPVEAYFIEAPAAAEAGDES